MAEVSAKVVTQNLQTCAATHGDPWLWQHRRLTRLPLRWVHGHEGGEGASFRSLTKKQQIFHQEKHKKKKQNNWKLEFSRILIFFRFLIFSIFFDSWPWIIDSKSNNFSSIFLLELLFPPQPRRTGFRVSFCPLFWSHQELTKTMPVLNNPSGTSQQTQPSGTHWKINIESKHHPIEKEIHLPNLDFWVPC